MLSAGTPSSVNLLSQLGDSLAETCSTLEIRTFFMEMFCLFFVPKHLCCGKKGLGGFMSSLACLPGLILQCFRCWI